jgi:hypothetical protein
MFEAAGRCGSGRRPSDLRSTASSRTAPARDELRFEAVGRDADDRAMTSRGIGALRYRASCASLAAPRAATMKSVPGSRLSIREGSSHSPSRCVPDSSPIEITPTACALTQNVAFLASRGVQTHDSLANPRTSISSLRSSMGGREKCQRRPGRTSSANRGSRSLIRSSWSARVP